MRFATAGVAMLLVVPSGALVEESNPTRDLAGTIETIDIKITELRQDIHGNMQAGENTVLSLVLVDEEGGKTTVRWDEDTIIRSHRGKQLKKVTIGDNFREGDRAVVVVVDRDGTPWATEIRLAKR